MQRHLKCWLRRFASLLGAVYKCNCGLTGLRKAVRMSMTMLVLVAQARQQLMATFQYNRWITIRVVSDDVGISFGSCQVIFNNVLGMTRMASKIVPKLLQWWSRFAQKSYNCWRIIFPLPKTEDTDEIKVFFYDWEDKRQIEIIYPSVKITAWIHTPLMLRALIL